MPGASGRATGRYLGAIGIPEGPPGVSCGVETRWRNRASASGSAWRMCNDRPSARRPALSIGVSRPASIDSGRRSR